MSGNYAKILEDLGLSENEADVYLASLELGPSTAADIARASKVRRTNVYQVLETLQKKGLVATTFDGWKRLFAAEGPGELEKILETKKDKFYSILPELEGMHSLKGGEGRIKYYEGIEGVKAAYNRSLEDLTFDGYVVITAGTIDYWKQKAPDFFENYRKQRSKRCLNNRIIFPDTPDCRNQAKEARHYYKQYKFFPAGTYISVSITVMPHCVLIHQYDGPTMAIYIENKSIIKAHKESFEIMWNALPE